MADAVAGQARSLNTRVNSYAVAREAGVSRSVVSVVIHGKADRQRIAKATQARVRAAVKRLGYIPDLSIRDMFIGKSAGLLRMAAERMDTPEFIATLAPILAEKGYRLVPDGTDGGPVKPPLRVGSTTSAGAGSRAAARARAPVRARTTARAKVKTAARA